MNKNKKLICIALAVLIIIISCMSACKKKPGDGSEVVVVTDKNGVPITNEDGEAITVVLETEVVEVTNANGEKVYDENGEVKTSVIYHAQDVAVPVTDKDGNPVRDENGKVLTTMITVPPATESRITQVPLTDSNGSYITDANGETVTYTLIYTTASATPGDNSSNWGTTFGGSKNDLYTSVAATPDGGCIALAQSNSTDGTAAGLADGASTPFMVLLKYGQNGKLQWQKAVAGDGSLILSEVGVDSEGNIIAAGYTKATNLGFTNAGDYDGVVYKFNSTGDMQWVKGFGGSSTDGFYALGIGPDNSIVAAGMTASADGMSAQFGHFAGETSALIVKYDANGNNIFAKSYGSTGDAFSGVDVASDSSIYTVGNFSSKTANSLVTSFGKADAVIMRLDSNGNKIWHQQFGGTKIENFTNVVALNDGCTVVGRSQSNDNSLQSLGNQGGYDGIIVKYTQNGAIQWNTAFRGPHDEYFTDVKTASDGSFIVSGYSSSGSRDLKTVCNRGSFDAIVVTFTPTGQLSSAQGYGGSNEDKFNSVCVLSTGEYVACGSTLSADGDLVSSRVSSDGAHSVGMIARFK